MIKAKTTGYASRNQTQTRQTTQQPAHRKPKHTAHFHMLNGTRYVHESVPYETSQAFHFLTPTDGIHGPRSNPSTVAHRIFLVQEIIPSSPIAPNQHRTVSFSRSKLDTQAGSRRMVSLPRPRTQSHVTHASAAPHAKDSISNAYNATESQHLLRDTVYRLADLAQCSYRWPDAARFACPTYTSGVRSGGVLTL